MKRKSILFISLLVLMTLSLSSCLNDLEDFMGDFSGSPYIAELSESASAATGTVTREIIDPTKPATFSLRVNIASAVALDKPTKVTLALDNALISVYNADHGTSAIAVPAGALTISTYEVTIPAGKREADWEFSINATLVPNSLQTMYLLPVKIVSAENNVVVSGNYGTKLIRVLSRNKYDGIYEVTGTFVDYISAAWIGHYPKKVSLTTVSNDVVSWYDEDEAIAGYIFDTGAGLSYFGNFCPGFRFNTTTDDIAQVFNAINDPAPRSRGAQLYTGPGAASNKFNPADKSIDVTYNFVQMNVSPTLRSLMTEHYKYVGPRP